MSGTGSRSRVVTRTARPDRPARRPGARPPAPCRRARGGRPHRPHPAERRGVRVPPAARGPRTPRRPGRPPRFPGAGGRRSGRAGGRPRRPGPRPALGRAGQSPGDRRHLRRPPRAPAARRRGAAARARRRPTPRRSGADHVVAAVGGHEAERQRFFARMGFAPLTTRRIVTRRVAHPVAGRLAPGLAHRCPRRGGRCRPGVAPCPWPDRLTGPPGLPRACDGVAEERRPFSALLDEAVSRPVAVGRPLLVGDLDQERRQGAAPADRRADGGHHAGRRAPQVAGVQLDADDLLVRAGAQGTPPTNRSSP